jgi:hypothetical protein
MSKREPSDKDWKNILDSILSKIDKAEHKDTFYLCMALDKGKIKPELINSDFYYTLYLNATRHIEHYDLF